MVLSLMLCTVSFPVVARAIAAGDLAAARRRAERDLLFAGVVVLAGTATVIAAAPQIVELLFQRGAFHAGDTAATASVMRVYALGLLGHALVGALVRVYFSGSRPLWFPAGAMLLGVGVHAALGALWVGSLGAAGIALANAAGITAAAALLLHGVRRHGIPLSARRVAGGLARLAVAAVAATAAGGLAAARPRRPLRCRGCCSPGPSRSPCSLAAARAVRAPVVPDLLRAARRLAPVPPARTARLVGSAARTRFRRGAVRGAGAGCGCGCGCRCRCGCCAPGPSASAGRPASADAGSAPAAPPASRPPPAAPAGPGRAASAGAGSVPAAPGPVPPETPWLRTPSPPSAPCQPPSAPPGSPSAPAGPDDAGGSRPVRSAQ